MVFCSHDQCSSLQYFAFYKIFQTFYLYSTDYYYLSLSLSVCLSVCLFIQTYHFLPDGVCVRISFFSLSAFHLSLSPSIYLSLPLSHSIFLSLYFPLSLFSSSQSRLNLSHFLSLSLTFSHLLFASLYFPFRMSNFLVGLTFPYISQVNQHFVFAATITLSFHFSLFTFQFHIMFHLTSDCCKN